MERQTKNSELIFRDNSSTFLSNNVS